MAYDILIIYILVNGLQHKTYGYVDYLLGLHWYIPVMAKHHKNDIFIGFCHTELILTELV